MNPTIEEIRRELNKTFESVSEKWVKTSSILKKLNLDLVEQILYFQYVYTIFGF